MDSYRLITPTSSFSKEFEKIIYNQLIDYVENLKIINPQQHGFRKNLSCVTAMVEYIDMVLDILEKGEKVAGSFIDLSKAFDCVDISILLKSLIFNHTP